MLCALGLRVQVALTGADAGVPRGGREDNLASALGLEVHVGRVADTKEALIAAEQTGGDGSDTG